MTQVETIELAAVGRAANLGDLYDNRSDKFLHLSIFKTSIPESAKLSTHNRLTYLKYAFNNTIEEKFNTMDISAGLKLSIMGGLFQLEGSGKFFKDTKKSAKSAKASIINSISTEYQTISITDDSLHSIMNLDVLEQIDATHVVVGIQWGGYVFVSVEDSNHENKDQLTVQGNLKAKLTALAGKISAKDPASFDFNEKEKTELNKFNFELFGDILPDKVPQNLIDAINFMENATTVLQSANNGKGKAIKYSLIPVSLLRRIMKVSSEIAEINNQVDDSIVQHCVKLFDDTNRVEQKLNDLVESVKIFEKNISKNTVDQVQQLHFNYRHQQIELQKNLSEHLKKVRYGIEPDDCLEQIIKKAIEHPYSWKNIEATDFTKIKQEICFIKMMSGLNVKLLNKDQSLQMFLSDNYNSDIYILFYNDEFPKVVEKPMEIFRNMIENCAAEQNSTTIFVAVKNQLFNFVQEPKLSLYRNMKLVIENIECETKIPDKNLPELWSFNYMQNQLAKLLNEPAIPIGFVYKQLPDQKSAQELWPYYQWDDITETYANLFFRAEGNASRPFGEIQQESQTKITGIKLRGAERNFGIGITEYQGPFQTKFSKDGTYDVAKELKFNALVNKLEFDVENRKVWPQNTAIRIWKRIK